MTVLDVLHWLLKPEHDDPDVSEEASSEENNSNSHDETEGADVSEEASSEQNNSNSHDETGGS